MKTKYWRYEVDQEPGEYRISFRVFPHALEKPQTKTNINELDVFMLFPIRIA